MEILASSKYFQPIQRIGWKWSKLNEVLKKKLLIILDKAVPNQISEPLVFHHKIGDGHNYDIRFDIYLYTDGTCRAYNITCYSSDGHTDSHGIGTYTMNTDNTVSVTYLNMWGGFMDRAYPEYEEAVNIVKGLDEFKPYMPEKFENYEK